MQDIDDAGRGEAKMVCRRMDFDSDLPEAELFANLPDRE